MIKVNGISYGWGDVDVKIPGLDLVVQEISYDDEQEKEESYGRGNRPRGYGRGNYKASGKMSIRSPRRTKGSGRWSRRSRWAKYSECGVLTSLFTGNVWDKPSCFFRQ